MTPAADIRWQQRLSNFERALALLREAMVNGPAALNQLEKEGVIQRFEYCFDLAWKTTSMRSGVGAQHRANAAPCARHQPRNEPAVVDSRF